MTDCEHKYRRDVETCPYCELIEAERELDEARTTIGDLRLLVSVKEEARDEARALAREAVTRLQWMGLLQTDREQWQQRHPWLVEEVARDDP